MRKLVRFIISLKCLCIAIVDTLTTDRKTVEFMLEYHKKDPYRTWVMWIIRCKLSWWKFIDKLKRKKPLPPPMVGQAQSHCVAKCAEEIVEFYDKNDQGVPKK